MLKNMSKSAMSVPMSSYGTSNYLNALRDYHRRTELADRLYKHTFSASILSNNRTHFLEDIPKAPCSDTPRNNFTDFNQPNDAGYATGSFFGKCAAYAAKMYNSTTFKIIGGVVASVALLGLILA